MERQHKKYSVFRAIAAMLVLACLLPLLPLQAEAAKTKQLKKHKKLTGPARIALANYDTSEIWEAMTLLRRAGADVTYVNYTNVDPSGYDGLVIPGSYHDVHPKFYRQKVHGAFALDAKRDVFRFKVMKKFILAGKPVYGICGGLQHLNVLLGGTLRQNINGHLGCSRATKVKKGSFNYSIYGSTRTNTFHCHHVCPQKAAYGLIPTEWDIRNKNIEAMQHEKYPIYGVQYHPEFMGSTGVKIMKKFLTVCLKYRKKPIKVNREDFHFIRF